MHDAGAGEARLLLVEGESDCHTLWHYGVPALGITGARAIHLEGAADAPLDQILRIQADSTVWPAMHFKVPLPVASETVCGDDGFQHWPFRYATVGNIDLIHMGIGRSSVHGHRDAPSQDSAISSSNATQPACSRRCHITAPVLTYASRTSRSCSRRMPDNKSRAP